MIGRDHDHGVRLLRDRHVLSKNRIDISKVFFGYIIEPVVIRLRYLRLFRRRERRENVADRVRALKVDDGEIRQLRAIAKVIE